ncbi:MAG: hypothetical protein ACI4RN_02640 [Oscillospiraceae bacterium]
MTITELNGYIKRKQEIEDIEQELNCNHYAADSVTTCTPPSYTAHNKRIEGHTHDSSTISLLTRLSTLKSKQRACEEYINSIEDYQTRKMFRLRFIKGLNWTQVAHKVGGNTADSCRKRITRFLQKS